MTSKPRVCLVSDVRGWAFDQIAHEVEAFLSSSFEFSHFYAWEWMNGGRPRVDWSSYAVVFELFHKNPKMGIPLHHALGALSGQWFNSEKPAPPTAEDVALANRYRGFQCMTRPTYEALRGSCPGATYLTNPVDMRRFSQPTAVVDRVVASWNGNAGHRSNDGRLVKHFQDIVAPACEEAKVPLVFAEYSSTEGPTRRRKPEEMPEFYGQANVALCASEFEGASRSVMEAMASGLAVVATDVGNHREMRESQVASLGDSGILLVEKSPEAFAAALCGLTPKRVREMGEINRAEISARWSWGDEWTEKFDAFLRRAL